MEYGRVKGLDKKISRLVQGAINLSTDDLEGGFALLDAASEKGINTFDSAHIYGGGACDRVLGQPLDVFALVGAANGEEMDANLRAMEIELTSEEQAWLDLRSDTR